MATVYRFADHVHTKSEAPSEKTGKIIEPAFPVWVEPKIPVSSGPPPNPQHAVLATRLTARLRGTPGKPGPWPNVGRLIQNVLRFQLHERNLKEDEAVRLSRALHCLLEELTKLSAAKDIKVRDATHDETAQVESDMWLKGGLGKLTEELSRGGWPWYRFNEFFLEDALPRLRGGLTEEELRASELWKQGYMPVLSAVYLAVMPQVFKLYETEDQRARH